MQAQKNDVMMKMKKTKIVATISDRRCDVDFIKKLYDSGMDVVRLNTAHQSPEDTLQTIKNIREVSYKIAILLDTKGPEIRTTMFNTPLEVTKGQVIRIGGDRFMESCNECIYVSHDDFVNEVEIGKKILIDDGEVEIVVQGKEKDFLIGEIQNKGTIASRKSVNVPDQSFSLPALSDKDRQYVHFAIENGIDFIAHSFVRSKEDVLEIQNILDEQNSKIKIIAKIENQEGVNNLDEILSHVYGIMVARGDLAIEIPYEKIPGIQKHIINRCIESRKPVIIATQMLHSMIKNPRPTRAEVSDIANAIYSKADAIMLSGETAYGDYPVESVDTMAKVAAEVEKSRGDIHEITPMVLSTETSAYLTKSAVEASLHLNAKAIVADTVSGRTLRNISAYRGRKHVYAMTSEKRTLRELSLSFGITPFYMERYASTPSFVQHALETLVTEGYLTHNNKVVILAGNFGRNHGASFIEISNVKNLLKI